ncbi:hypothetical protein EMPS_10254 [Entomortierella parvispora]|uniref:GRIP domain-containing protein n=1 Tax=Entomortierella parvispora TaxID=205924 RepID=A0A9P3HJK8_9FUNG|nr:hypothetical protein EMPS_10254 [Entomortierella parvispora]
MFNTLLKKASESSFAALASEALDSRPGSPAAARRPPGSPLAGQQQQQQNGGSSPARKPRNGNPRAAGTVNPLSSNAQLAAQLDEAHNDLETYQRMLQKSAQEKLEIAKDVGQLRDEKEALNEELIEARAVIKAMRATLEDKATDEFLSPTIKGTDGISASDDKQVPSITALMDDPLGATLTPNQNEDVETKPEEKETVKGSAGASASVPAKDYSADIAILEAKVTEATAALTEKNGQCKELEGSLTQRTNELAKQKSDHDEKMKKMKAIFAAANKNLNEYRQSIAAKDEEIAELKSRLDSKGPSEEQVMEQSQLVQELETELKKQSEQAATKLEQVESKYRQTNVQLEKLKTEYQQYKQRASLLLQQQRESVQADDDSKERELQLQLDALSKENRSVVQELQDADSKRSALESELQLAMDQIASLESSHEMNRRQERQHARQLKDLERSFKESQREREAAESRLASLQELRQVEAQSLMQELGGTTKHIEDRLAKKEEENAELQKILDRSSDELAVAKQEIQNLRDLISSAESSSEAPSFTHIQSGSNQEVDGKGTGQLAVSTALGPRSSFSPFDQESPISRASSSLSLPAERPPVYSTLSDLLASKPLVERSPFGGDNGSNVGLGSTSPLTSSKEKEYQVKLQHLSELLNESEANHQRLLDQEKVLKEEIRSLDRAERRQNLSVDYLKNIVLKYLETSDREQLLPVLTTVLQLSPAEVASLRKKTIQNSTSSLVLGGFFGGGGGQK